MNRRTALLFLVGMPVLGAEKEKPQPRVDGPSIAVGGQVEKPGPQAFRRDTTVLAAIFSAGGATKFAALRRVKIHRGGKTKVVDLTKEAGKLEKVQDGDVIEVPQMNLFGR